MYFWQNIVAVSHLVFVGFHQGVFACVCEFFKLNRCDGERLQESVLVVWGHDIIFWPTLCFSILSYWLGILIDSGLFAQIFSLFFTFVAFLLWTQSACSFLTYFHSKLIEQSVVSHTVSQFVFSCTRLHTWCVTFHQCVLLVLFYSCCFWSTVLLI